MAEIPRVLGDRYEVGDLIGRGGMAQVHLGYDTRLSRTVAVKVLRTDHATDPTFIARFRREAQSAAALNHPSIVAVYDTGEETVESASGRTMSLPYIVMEYVKGRTVSQLLSKGDALPINEAVQIVVGVLSALEYSHREGIVHRDIKPGNIMLTPDGKVKVMDFGIARAIADSAATMTQTNSVVGTAQYLSPEQARGEVVDARSDLYSTGCLLYELLTGQPPFRGDSAVAVAYQHVSQEPANPKSIAADVPDAIDRVVMKSLAKRREDRYQSAADMRSDLLAASRGEHVSAPAVSAYRTEVVPAPTQVAPAQAASAPSQQTATQPQAEPEEKESKRNKTFIVLGVILLLLAVVGIGWAIKNANEDPRANETTAVQTTVPDLTGMNETQVREALQAVNLKLNIGDPVEDDDIAEGLYVSSNPQIGSTITEGETVTVHFSSGKGSVNVPDLTNGSYTQDQAKQALEAAGLEVGRVDTKDVPGRASDIVAETSPAAGTKVERGSSVNLVVASGEIVLEDVRGMSRSDAETLLRSELKVPLISITESETADAEPGTVIAQSPLAGKVPFDQSVELVIAKAPPPQPTPEPTQAPPAPNPQPEPEPEPNTSEQSGS
ncbi:Stk1 family PASTA domain-containing Ser/Thr kinase [Trueperella bialowiezensis]|uniref:non-specific serine/threonine protein kinase n=1 Tax=Trueperella bialowiezensis TaxID=312285 RepID=A0A3S4X5Y2_9ACTO|nr:Stk1 family PASTA domain-containing Ser/Thr kinase [Trueperella bialowiezensis]VEI13363.1 Serine/threonine-protein kinase pknB [Trueperella bialowiezensis]